MRTIEDMFWILPWIYVYSCQFAILIGICRILYVAYQRFKSGEVIADFWHQMWIQIGLWVVYMIMIGIFLNILYGLYLSLHAREFSYIQPYEEISFWINNAVFLLSGGLVLGIYVKSKKTLKFQEKLDDKNYRNTKYLIGLLAILIILTVISKITYDFFDGRTLILPYYLILHLVFPGIIAYGKDENDPFKGKMMKDCWKYTVYSSLGILFFYICLLLLFVVRPFGIIGLVGLIFLFTLHQNKRKY